MYQVDSIDDLTPQFLAKAIKKFDESKERKKFIRNWDYFRAENTFILTRDLPDDSGPDNKIPVSYGRRIVNLVVGYMYKPGLVNYAFEDDKFKDNVTEVFDANKEPIKTEQLGKQSSIQGVGYEYHYVKDADTGSPRFAKLQADEVIPFYNSEIEPELIAFVRYVWKDEGEKKIAQILYADDKDVKTYAMPEGSAMTMTEEARHFYREVPLVVYRNNEEEMGDFDAVKRLIDAYDVLMSDSMNEFDRFAWAYLLLKGMSLSQENAEKVKQLRVFENLDEAGDVSFLTKDIATEFIKFMADLLRAEIHRQSGIPNLEDYDGAGASGQTMTKFIYLMELFTDPKESYFKEGLHKRITLVNEILNIQGKGGDPKDVKIIMNRNTPDNSKEQAEIFNLYSGQVSRKTLLENFADFVDDPDEEIKQLEDEAPVMDMFDDTGMVDDADAT